MYPRTGVIRGDKGAGEAETEGVVGLSHGAWGWDVGRGTRNTGHGTSNLIRGGDRRSIRT